MSNSFNSDHDHVEAALREGLRGLPSPAISPDFDARVLAGLRRPLPWWIPAWQMLRPAVTAAACSLAITLLFVQWARASSPLPPRVTSSAPAPAVDLLDAIDRPVVHAAFLTTLMSRPAAKDPDGSFDSGRDTRPDTARVVRRGQTWTLRPS